MSRFGPIARFVFALCMAAFIAVPMPMLASDTLEDVTEATPSEVVIQTGDETEEPVETDTQDDQGEGTEGEGTEGEGTEGAEPKVTEGEDTEVEGTEGEGTEVEGTEGEGTEGEGTEGEGTEGEGTEGEGAEGEGTEGEDTDVQGPEQIEIEIAPASDMQPLELEDKFWCNNNNRVGSAETWRNSAPEGADLDCFDISVITHECGILDMQFDNYLVGLTSNLYWTEGPAYVWNSRSTVYPITFPEDYNNGSVMVTVALATPEDGYVWGSGDDALAHWSKTQYNTNGTTGQQYIINTDCLPNIPSPEENPDYYCETRPTSGSVATWLQNAPDGYNTDCLNVGIPVQACGTLEIPYENLTSYNSALYWNVGDAPNSDTAQPLPITAGTFAEDEGGGEVVVTVWIGHPESDYYAFIGEADQPYTWNTVLGTAGVQFTIDTDCEEPEPVNYCHYPGSHIGEVYSWLNNAPEDSETDCIDVGTPVQVCGSLDIPFESRITGFNSEYMLYWAYGTEIPDDDSLWNTTWPITTEEDQNGGSVDVIVFIGGPEDDYYHFANEDPYPYPYPNQDRGDIPARSLGGGVQFTIDTDCVLIPAELALPAITASVCDDANQPTPIVVTEPEDSESVTYSEVTAVSGPEGLTFTITATVNHGFTFEGITPPEGWTVVDNGLATYSVTLALADCEVPLKVATPELPKLVAAMCDDDNEPVLPTLTVPETEGITYGEVTVGPANSVLLSLTATANEGYTFAGATLPEGWTLVNSSEAVYEIIAEEADCPTPEPTETPTPDPTTPEPTVPATPDPTETPKPEDPKEKAPEVTELPTTGTGSNPAPMIGLAATAAVAIAGAGLFFTNRKR